MKNIIIKTQKELDALPNDFSEYTVIEIRSNELIYVRKARENSSVEAWENSRVEAWENSSVEAWENSSVEAWENSSVVAWENSSVVARGSSRVEARDSSSVVARGSSRVEARDSSSVVARENSSVVARENSSVVAWGSSRVEARDSSSVVAWGNSRVVAFDCAFITVWSTYVVIKKLYDFSHAIFRRGEINITEKHDTATAFKVTDKQLNRSFKEELSRGYVKADGIIKKLINQKKIGDIEVFEVEEFLKKTSSYVVKRGETFSHGETVEKAIDDLRYKITDRDKSEFEHWRDDLDKEISLDDAIQGYRVITGACEFGVKNFLSRIDLPKVITPNVVLMKTQNAYGHEDLREFLR